MPVAFALSQVVGSMTDVNQDLKERHDALAATVKGIAKSAELRNTVKAANSSSSNSRATGGSAAAKNKKAILTPNSRFSKHLSSGK